MSTRINTAQNIYFNNDEVDSVYYNNELIATKSVLCIK